MLEFTLSNITSDVNLFDFNKNTGVLSNAMTFDFPYGVSSYGPYGIEFSPNSSLLYVSFEVPPYKLYQFNLKAGSQALIDSSRTVVGVPISGGGALQIGPDGKIYQALWAEDNIAVINNPNVLGSGCNLMTQMG